MIEYINEIKRQLRDTYKFKPDGGTENEPLFNDVPDATYPMLIEGQMDRVRVAGGRVHCCNFDPPAKFETIDGTAGVILKNLYAQVKDPDIQTILVRAAFHLIEVQSINGDCSGRPSGLSTKAYDPTA